MIVCSFECNKINSTVCCKSCKEFKTCNMICDLVREEVCDEGTEVVVELTEDKIYRRR